MTAVDYISKNEDLIKKFIFQYFLNFVDGDTFNEDAYEDSAIEGELIEEVNTEFFGEGEFMCDDEDEFNYIDRLADEVIEWEGLESVKEYFETNRI